METYTKSGPVKPNSLGKRVTVQVDGSPRYSRKALLSSYKTLALKLGRTPEQKDIDGASKNQEILASSPTYKLVFGSMYQLQIEAKLTPTRFRKVGKKVLLKQFKDLAQTLGRLPNADDLKNASREHKIASIPAFMSEFGSLLNVQREAGFEPSRLVNLEDKDLIEQYKLLARILCRVPTSIDITNANKAGLIEIASNRLFQKRFGSITNLRKKSGFSSEKLFKQHTLASLCLQYYNFEQKLGHQPTARDVMRASRKEIASHTTLLNYFGSLNSLRGNLLTLKFTEDEFYASLRKKLDTDELLSTQEEIMLAERVHFGFVQAKGYFELYKEKLGDLRIWIIGQVRKKIEQLGRLSPVMLRRNHEVLYQRIKAAYQNGNGKVDWLAFSGQIPSHLRKRWTTVEHLTYEDCVERVLDLLANVTSKPRKFGPTWISKNARKVYRKLVIFLPRSNENKEEVDWTSFVTRLPSSWQQQWTYEHDFPLEDCLPRLIKQLELAHPKPKVISPFWFASHDLPAYSKIVNFGPRKKNGSIDWDSFIAPLPEEWRSKWTYLVGIWGKYPSIEEYQNREELQDVLNEFEEKLYLVPCYEQLQTNESRKTANDIVQKLIKLVQSGNLNARELLEGDLRFVCEDWVSRNFELQSFVIAADSLRNRIRACIYNYKNKGNFFSYLFASLKMSADTLPGTKTFEDWEKPQEELS